MAILETKDLRKIYGSGENEVHALDGVSISVEESEFVAVIGTSGSGKSTLLNMIGGVDRPTSGSVTIRGKELLKMREQTFEDIDIEEIPDIKDIVIDKGKSKKARIRERLDAGQNPYFIKSGNVLVKMSYAATERTIEDALKTILSAI